MTVSGKLSDESTITARLFEVILNMPQNEQQALLKELQAGRFKGRRRHGRKPFFMVVDYTSQDFTYNDFIQNVSAGGVFIETSMPFSLGQQVLLTFPLPDYQKHIKISGEIVWTSAQGIGVKFKKVNRNQELMIKSLLKMI